MPRVHFVRHIQVKKIKKKTFIGIGATIIQLGLIVKQHIHSLKKPRQALLGMLWTLWGGAVWIIFLP